MQWNGKIAIAIGDSNQYEVIGQEEFHPVKIPDRGDVKLMMWKTTYNSQWTGVSQDKVYECGEDGIGRQIGWVGFRRLMIETGETVMLMMTKGMQPGACWAGDVGGTAYQEREEGKGTRIGQLEFRPVKLEDGSQTVILMFRADGQNSEWVGVRNGKVIGTK